MSGFMRVAQPALGIAAGMAAGVAVGKLGVAAGGAITEPDSAARDVAEPLVSSAAMAVVGLGTCVGAERIGGGGSGFARSVARVSNTPLGAGALLGIGGIGAVGCAGLVLGGTAALAGGFHTGHPADVETMPASVSGDVL